MTIWNIISIPLGVIGFLSLSDALITFHENIHQIIVSYHAIVYPVFKFIFAWLWFEVPRHIFDYLFLGILFASSERKVWGFRSITENRLKDIGLHLCFFLFSTLFWPFISFQMIYETLRTNSDGLFTELTKGPNPIHVKYMRRDQDILVFRYLGAVILIFILILILNYTYLIKAQQ